MKTGDQKEYENDSLFDKERLRECIEDSKLTQIAFSKEVGVSRVTVYKWLYGPDVPSKRHLSKIARVLGIEADYLFGGPYKTQKEKADAFFGPYEELKKLSNNMVEKWLQINGYIHVYTMIWEEFDLSDTSKDLFLADQGTVLMKPGSKEMSIKLLRIEKGKKNDAGQEIEGFIYSKNPDRLNAPLRMYYDQSELKSVRMLEGEIIIKDPDDLQFLALELLDFLELRFEQITEKSCRNLPGLGPGSRQYLKAVKPYLNSVSKISDDYTCTHEL